jgi:hypothetical protein
MRPQVIQLVLQFRNRLFEVELMLHASGIITGFSSESMHNWTTGSSRLKVSGFRLKVQMLRV